jgi:hypothetical protein
MFLNENWVFCFSTSFQPSVWKKEYQRDVHHGIQFQMGARMRREGIYPVKYASFFFGFLADGMSFS